MMTSRTSQMMNQSSLLTGILSHTQGQPLSHLLSDFKRKFPGRRLCHS